MHEVSIAEGILSAVKSTLVNEPQAKVTSVTVSIGELAGIEIQALLFAWDSVTRGTLADESKLVINRVAGEAWCMKCAKTWLCTDTAILVPRAAAISSCPSKGMNSRSTVWNWALTRPK